MYVNKYEKIQPFILKNVTKKMYNNDNSTFEKWEYSLILHLYAFYMQLF